MIYEAILRKALRGLPRSVLRSREARLGTHSKVTQPFRPLTSRSQLLGAHQLDAVIDMGARTLHSKRLRHTIPISMRDEEPILSGALSSIAGPLITSHCSLATLDARSI